MLKWSRKEKDKRSKVQRTFIEVAKLTGLAALLSPANHYLANFILFHPDKTTQVDQTAIKAINERFNTTWTDEFFQAKDGTKLHGWFIKNPNATKTFLVSHGNSGNLAYRLILIASLVHCGGSVFVYDYRGFGKSEGIPTPDGIKDDGIAAYDYLTGKLNTPDENVVLYGESLGCAVSTLIGQERKVAGIVLQSGFSSIIEAAGDRLPWMKLYPESSFPQRFLDNVTAYKVAHPPLLLLHGEKDSILPSRYSKTIFDSAIEPKQLVLLPNTAHHDVFRQDVLASTSAVQGFLKNMISHTVAMQETSSVSGAAAAKLVQCTK